MLAVESLRGSNGEEGALGSFSIGVDETFGDEAFLDDVSFGDLFMGIDVDGDVLPDLELDPAEIFAEFSVGSAEAEESATSATPGAVDAAAEGLAVEVEVEAEAGEGDKEVTRGEEVVSAAGKEEAAASLALTEESNKSRKPSPAAKSLQSQGKRKAKVDWTPELHRRFVQAVEQLGIDKAVPSRILELMGIDCLTRHNIASHLQKYRSHRKHLLAREAEAASWSQRRQFYSGGGGGGTGSGAKRPDINPWLAPTIGFPHQHPPLPPPPTQVQPFRPLHVWGHPTVGEGAPMPASHLWLRHLTPRSPTPTQPWAAAQPPVDPSYWHHHYPRGIVRQAMTQGTPCFPQPLPAARFAGATMPGIVPHHPIYSAIPPPPLAVLNKLSNSELQLDAHPSVESIDAAIGDVLAKPWLPLPLGLKPPAVDSVLVELQKHGVSKVPPSRA